MNFKTAFKIFDPANQKKTDLKPSAELSMIVLNQTHSDIIVDVPNVEMDGDASITTKKNTICMVLTADCLPILVIDKSLHKVAAIHAGWRGLASGIIEKALSHFSPQAKVIIAPSISGEVYEIGKEVVDEFRRFDNCYTKIPNGKFLLDIRAIAQNIITNIGVNDIVDFSMCTFQSSLPSYRRDRTRLRLASMVWIEG